MLKSAVVSCFFATASKADTVHTDTQTNVSEDFLFLIDELNRGLERFQMPRQVECTYNPTKYARNTFEMYVRKYCSSRKSIMFFGMNPGPWGMSQTGVSKT